MSKKKTLFDTVDDVIMKIELWSCYIMIAAMILSVFGNALFRLFGNAIDWSTDMAQLMFIWVSVLGADMAMKKSRHVGMDLILRRIPEKVSKWIMVAIYVLCIVFLVGCAYYGFGLAVQNSLRRFNTLPLSYSWVTVAVPVGFCLMTYTSLRHISFLVFNRENYYDDKFEDLEEQEDVV